MALVRLCKFASRISKDNGLLQRHLASRTVIQGLKNDKSNDDGKTENDLDTPLKYSGSKAETWTAKESRTGRANDDMLWYQPYVISLSLAVFLIYFCILREENDVDEKLGKSLYNHIEGLEEKQILMSITYNKEKGESTAALEARLAELQLEELQKKNR